MTSFSGQRPRRCITKGVVFPRIRPLRISHKDAFRVQFFLRVKHFFIKGREIIKRRCLLLMTTTPPPLNFYVFAIQVKIWYQYVIQHTQHDINKYTISHAILCMLTTHTMIHYDTQYCNTLRFHKMIPPESTKGSSDPSADSCTFPNSPISQND